MRFKYTILFFILYVSSVIGQSVSFIPLKHFYGKNKQVIDNIYTHNEYTYISIRFKEELISDLISSQALRSTSIVKTDENHNLLNQLLLTADTEVKVLDFIAADGNYIVSLESKGNMTINDSINIDSRALVFKLILLIDENLGLIDYVTVTSDNEVNICEDFLYDDGALKIVVYGKDGFKVEQSVIELSDTNIESACIDLPIMNGKFKSDSLKVYHISNSGLLKITNQCILNERHYLSGVFTQDLVIGEDTFFNKSFREDVFIAELEDGILINGFNLASSSADESRSLNIYNDQLILTSYMYRVIDVTPNGDQVKLPGYGLLMASYDEELELNWAKGLSGLELGNMDPIKYSEQSFLLPTIITSDITFQDYYHEIPGDRLFETHFLLINDEGEFIDAFIPPISGSYIAYGRIRNGGDIAVVANYDGDLDGIESNGFDAVLMRMEQSSSNLDNIKSDIYIYPNPISSEFYISDSEKVERITLYNFKGEQVRSFSNAESYEVSGLNNGIYICVVNVGGQRFNKIITILR